MADEVSQVVAAEAVAPSNVHRLHEPADPLLCQWARFRDQFAAGMVDGYSAIEDIEQKIASKRAFFFPGKDAALVGEVQVYPTGQRAMQILWAAGDPAESVEMLPGVEAIARMMGCTSVLIEGRRAWERLLKDQGYAFWSMTICKEL